MNKLLIFLALLLPCQLAIGQTKNFIDTPYLETTATVDTLVQPDLIHLDILINEKDLSRNVSVEEMETNMIQTLKSLGIETEKQLTLTDLSSNFKKYFLRQDEIMKSKSYDLMVSDAKMAGRVLVGLEDIGLSNVQLGKTEYSQMEQLKLILKSKAIEKAKRQADYLVKPLNQKVVRAIHITDQQQNLYTQVYAEEVVIFNSESSDARDEYRPPAIEFKPIKVQNQVTVKFEIE